MSKVVIISAPSGTGKSTVIKKLLEEAPELRLRFSISATSRAPRGEEQNGIDYYFLSPEEFRQRIENEEFLEHEEVYAGRYYGTLKSEVERIGEMGDVAIFDVDVVGGLNIKRYYGDQALAIFILPPSLSVLKQRLEGRNTDSAEVIAERLAKAEQEISLSDGFDRTVVNDDLTVCYREVKALIEAFLNRPY